MAAMEIGQRTLAAASSASAPAADHMHHPAALPATITFPYGLPGPGDYRIFVQVKRQERIETGAFDAHVSPDIALDRSPIAAAAQGSLKLSTAEEQVRPPR